MSRSGTGTAGPRPVLPARSNLLDRRSAASDIRTREDAVPTKMPLSHKLHVPLRNRRSRSVLPTPVGVVLRSAARPRLLRCAPHARGGGPTVALTISQVRRDRVKVRLHLVRREKKVQGVRVFVAGRGRSGGCGAVPALADSCETWDE
jgi:hypothetical protein